MSLFHAQAGGFKLSHSKDAPLVPIYRGTGGRDTYVSFDNGGHAKWNDLGTHGMQLLSTQVSATQGGTQLYVGKDQRGPRMDIFKGHHPRAANYQQNGSGRDTYILNDNGGNYPLKRPAEFNNKFEEMLRSSSTTKSQSTHDYMVRRNNRMKNYVADLGEEHQLKMILQNQCGQAGMLPLHDPFSASQGFLTNKTHLKQQGFKGQFQTVHSDFLAQPKRLQKKFEDVSKSIEIEHKDSIPKLNPAFRTSQEVKPAVLTESALRGALRPASKATAILSSSKQVQRHKTNSISNKGIWKANRHPADSTTSSQIQVMSYKSPTISQVSSVLPSEKPKFQSERESIVSKATRATGQNRADCMSVTSAGAARRSRVEAIRRLNNSAEILSIAESSGSAQKKNALASLEVSRGDPQNRTLGRSRHLAEGSLTNSNSKYHLDDEPYKQEEDTLDDFRKKLQISLGIVLNNQKRDNVSIVSHQHPKSTKDIPRADRLAHKNRLSMIERNMETNQTAVFDQSRQAALRQEVAGSREVSREPSIFNKRQFRGQK